MRRNYSSYKDSGGMGFSSVLLLIFITLKLTGHINWSWFWVLSPIWGSPVLILLIMFFVWIFRE